MRKKGLLFLFFSFCFLPAYAAEAPSLFEGPDFLNMHSQIRIVGFLTLLSLLPFAVMMMTSFTRILIILHFLRQAVGTPQMPSNPVVIGLALILTLFVMNPAIEEVRDQAINPYMQGEFAHHPDVKMALRGEESILLEKMWNPIRSFLLNHTREKDLSLFLNIANIPLPTESSQFSQEVDATSFPWYCILPAFIISELRTAFMMGFLLFIPFIIIDMVIASILMSMGMMMLPPAMISLPFKVLLFILFDGWHLIIERILKSFLSLTN